MQLVHPALQFDDNCRSLLVEGEDIDPVIDDIRRAALVRLQSLAMTHWAAKIGGQGELAGEAMTHLGRDAFQTDHLRVLLAINPKVSLTIENALKFQQAAISATTDAATTVRESWPL